MTYRQQNYNYVEKTFSNPVKKNLANNVPLSALIFIYVKPINESFTRKIYMAQYKVAVVITGAAKGTFRDRPYLELD